MAGPGGGEPDRPRTFDVALAGELDRLLAEHLSVLREQLLRLCVDCRDGPAVEVAGRGGGLGVHAAKREDHQSDGGAAEPPRPPAPIAGSPRPSGMSASEPRLGSVRSVVSRQGVTPRTSAERSGAPQASAQPPWIVGPMREMSHGSSKGSNTVQRSSTYSTFINSTRRKAVTAAFVKQSSMQRSKQLTLDLEQPSLNARMKGRAGRLMQRASCNYLICAVIMTSIIAMGLEVDEVGRRNEALLAYVQGACNIFFVLELLARLYAEDRRFFCGQDRLYNLLDLALAGLGVFDMAAQGLNRAASDRSVQQVMILRVLRIVRVTRVMRMLRFVRPLRVLVRSICATMRPLAYALVLLSLIMYSFAVVFTEASNSDEESDGLARHFGTLPKSVLTLFKSISNGISWELAFDPLLDAHWLFGALFVLYVVFAQLTVLNVMTGQFCSNAIESSHRDDEDLIADYLANKSFYVAKFVALFADIAGDDEMLTVDTLEQTFRDNRMQAFLHSLGIKVSDAFTLFHLLDDSTEHCIDLGRFVEGCLKLRGNATAIGLDSLAHEIRWLTHHLNKHLLEIKDLAAGACSDGPSAVADGGADAPAVAIPV